MQFKIVVPMYNAGNWIEENLRVIQKQSFKDFHCIVIDDLSSDGSADRVRQVIGDDCRFTLLVNRNKLFSMGNVCKAIDFSKPANEDIIVLVDADDMLAHYDVLQHISDVYRQTRCWMTYGSFRDRSSTNREKVCRPYSDQIVKKGSFRKSEWRASHLKTFKYHLWHEIKPESFTVSEAEVRREGVRALLYGRVRTWHHWRKIRAVDLVDESGRYVRRCVDKAVTYPLLELAGPKSLFIKEILYVYNSYGKDLPFGNGNSDAKWCQRLVRTILKNKGSYSVHSYDNSSQREEKKKHF